MLLWAAVAAVLLGGAPAASAAPALIEGDWGYAGGVVSVARDPGGGFTGTVTRSGSQQCAGSPGEVVWRSIAATRDPSGSPGSTPGCRRRPAR